jgi:hypothetical protein
VVLIAMSPIVKTIIAAIPPAALGLVIGLSSAWPLSHADLPVYSDNIEPTSLASVRKEIVPNMEYMASFRGRCEFKLVAQNSFVPCDPIAKFVNLKTHRSYFVFTIQNAADVFVFEGGKDHQPNLETYILSVDTAKNG